MDAEVSFVARRASRFVVVLVWCRSCRHQHIANLDAPPGLRVASMSDRDTRHRTLTVLMSLPGSTPRPGPRVCPSLRCHTARAELLIQPGPERTPGPTLSHGMTPLKGAVHDRGSDLEHQMCPPGDQRISC